MCLPMKQPFCFLLLATLSAACAVDSFDDDNETAADVDEDPSADGFREGLVFPAPVGFDVTETAGAPPVWVHFTNPAANNGRDLNILAEVIRLIDQTEDNGVIRAAIH